MHRHTSRAQSFGDPLSHPTLPRIAALMATGTAIRTAGAALLDTPALALQSEAEGAAVAAALAAAHASANAQSGAAAALAGAKLDISGLPFQGVTQVRACSF